MTDIPNPPGTGVPGSPGEHATPSSAPEEPPRWELVQPPVPVAPPSGRGRIWQALLAVGVAAVLVVAVVASVTAGGNSTQTASTSGGGSALAAADPTATPTPAAGAQCQAFLNDLAQRLGVSTSKLQSAVTGALQDMIDQAVQSGRLSQSEATTLKSRLTSAADAGCVGLPGLRELGPDHAGFPGFRGGPAAGALDPTTLLNAAASALKIDAATLQNEIKALQPGQDLRTIAQQHGVDYTSVTNAIHDAAKQQLDAAVTKGTLTASQESAILSALDSRLAQGQLPFGPFGARGWGGMGGRPGGFAPWGGRGQQPAPTASPNPPAGA